MRAAPRGRGLLPDRDALLPPSIKRPARGHKPARGEKRGGLGGASGGRGKLPRTPLIPPQRTVIVMLRLGSAATRSVTWKVPASLKTKTTLSPGAMFRSSPAAGL